MTIIHFAGGAGWIKFPNGWIEIKSPSSAKLFSERNGYVKTLFSILGFRILWQSKH